MAARKLTKSPEGEVVTFSTKRGKPDTCSERVAVFIVSKGNCTVNISITLSVSVTKNV